MILPASVVAALPPPPPGYDDIILGLYPEAYWKLDESSGSTAFDAVNSHDGTYAAVATLGQTPLTPDASGTSVSFGDQGNVIVPYSAQIQANAAFTFIALIKVAVVDAVRTIFHSGNFAVSSQRGIRLYIANTSRALGIEYYIGGWGGGNSSLIVPLNTTVSVGCRYDGATTVSIFLNGVKYDYTLPGTPEGTTSIDFTLFGNATVAGSVVITEELNGIADSVAWFPTALSDEQLDTIFDYMP